MTIVQQNMKRIIEEQSLMKSGVARRAGFTNQQMADMLAGRKIIRAEMIPALAKAMNCTPMDLLQEPAEKLEEQ